MYHGEKVAFGTIAQLVLENVEAAELQEIIVLSLDYLLHWRSLVLLKSQKRK